MQSNQVNVAKEKRQIGRLITFEGTEGAGKSTLMQAVSEVLQKKSIPHQITREPGGTALAEKIRELILNHSMSHWTELFLYEAARAEHVAQVIRPALKKGQIVLCDRFTDSTLAYQSTARGLDWKTVSTLNEWATQGLRPDLTVWIDIEPAHGLARATQITRFEQEGLAFQKKVRRGFLKAMRDPSRRWLRLPAGEATPVELAKRVIDRIEKMGNDLTVGSSLDRHRKKFSKKPSAKRQTNGRKKF